MIMAHPKTTGKKAASSAGKLLSKSKSKIVKRVVASDLSQKHGRKHRR